MTNIIVTTTINPPTEAIRRFDAMPDWKLIVIGDRKTPPDYRLERGIYVSPSEQEKYDPGLSAAIGWDCVQRRNFGFLLAHELGADVVATVDDDNVPLEGWGKGLMIGREVRARYCRLDALSFNPLSATTRYRHLWHRGFPLQLLGQRTKVEWGFDYTTFAVQADFWNGDPDVDAICRMIHAPECAFDPRDFPFFSNAPAPFNSQNTFLDARLLPDYFMFPGVGRQDDIWAAYYLQAKGARVVFGAPSVYHKRNPHDLIADMKAEYLGYEKNLALVTDLAREPEAIMGYLPTRAIEAWRLYRRHFGVD